MKKMAFFSDVSFDPQRNIGVGAYLLVPFSFFNDSPETIEKDEIIKKIVTKKFNNTSSTKLEIETVLFGLKENREKLKNTELKIFTDSQCITGLLKRREELIKNDFCSKRSKKLLNNAELYLKFYELYDELNFEVIKIKGHQKTGLHDYMHKIFSFVDKESRKKLRQYTK